MAAERSLSIAEHVYEPDHPEVGVGLYNLAQVMIDAGEFGEARPLTRRALVIAESAYDAGHPIIERRRTLAHITREIGP